MVKLLYQVLLIFYKMLKIYDKNNINFPKIKPLRTIVPLRFPFKRKVCIDKIWEGPIGIVVKDP